MTGFRLRHGAGAIAIAIALGSVLACAGPAAAGPKAAEPTRIAAAELSRAADSADGASAIVKSDEEPGCYRARKRLWVEGEGWIVRRVTTCR